MATAHPPPPQLDAALKERLIARFGSACVEERLDLENHPTSGSEHLLTTERLQYPRPMALLTKRVLKGAGLYQRGRHNAQNPALREQQLPLRKLPDTLKGLRLLHLSDLHLCDDPHYFDAILRVLEQGQREAEAIFLTGDFIDTLALPSALSWHQLHTFLNRLERPAYAVLGNHDPLLVALTLEDHGVEVLFNEKRQITLRNTPVTLAGVDDSARFRNAAIPSLTQADPRPAILLAHTPHSPQEAAAEGYHLYLCGHTHGGQICLPGGHALIDRTRGRRRLTAGLWSHGEMTGYTTRGLGTTGCHVRLLAPAEGVLHTLTTSSEA